MQNIKLTKVKNFWGYESGESNGVCWTYKGLDSNYCIQKFSEYFGMETRLYLWRIDTKKAVSCFYSVKLSDFRKMTSVGLEVMKEIDEEIQSIKKRGDSCKL